jgi:hypothetical protein
MSKAKDNTKKTTMVREHQMHIPISENNPIGITTRNRHLRRLKGTYLDAAEIKAIFKNYDRKGIAYPTKRKLAEKYKDADKFDEIIALWTDFFNKKFNANPPIDSDVVKALISSESDFNPDPLGNRQIAIGIAQITKKTLKILQDPEGEAKEFIFKNIRQKDLKDPNISIPMAVRWLHRKEETAARKLKRSPSHEEIILEYKGLLKSDSDYKKAGLKKYREAYATLKK